MSIEPIKGFYVHDEVTDSDGVAQVGIDGVDGLETMASAEVCEFSKDHSVVTNANPVNYESPTSETNWECAVVACTAGDVFYVKGWGGNGTRLYAFVDANHNYINSNIAPAGTHLTEYTRVVAPDAAVVLVVNGKYTEMATCLIKGKSVGELVDDVRVDFNLSVDKKLDYDNGSNICNAYDDSLVNDNKYVIYNAGRLATLSDWSSIMFPVEGGEEVTTTSAEGAHISFYSKYTPDFGELPSGAYLNGYISGVAGQLTGYEVPENAKYMVVSIPTSRKSTIQVQYGAVRTAYEPYIEGLKASKVIGLELVETVVYNIKADGSGDFANLKTCFESITDASPSKKYVVNLYPGTYDIGSLYSDTATERGLFLPNYTKLRGVGDKRNIIVKAELEDGSTNFSTMNFRDICEIENLTITSYNCRYTIHDDFQTTSDAENYRYCKDVIFIGDHTQYGSVYGSGLHGNADWTFENCYFDATTAASNGTGGNSFSNHNAVNTSKPSFIKFVNCRLNGSGTYKTMHLMSMNNNAENGTVSVTLEGCKVDGIYLGENYPDQYGTGIKYWVSGFGNVVGSLGVEVVSTDGIDHSGNVDLI